VEFRKELPISSAGKVLRRLLQEEEKGKLFGAEIRKLGNF
jgi:acyl-CoA synthetase (AMP-forming)/AMP-acid ligase II